MQWGWDCVQGLGVPLGCFAREWDAKICQLGSLLAKQLGSIHGR